MMTREKKKVAKKAKLVSDLREKNLQVGKRPNPVSVEYDWNRRSSILS